MAVNVFGIEIGSGGLRIAMVEKQFRVHRTLRLAHRDARPEDTEATAATLKDTMAELGFDRERDQVIAVFPGDKVTSRRLFIPLIQRRQITEALPFELESLVPFDADDIVCEYVMNEKTGDGSKILALIARRDDMERFLEMYRLAGLDPVMVIPEPLAAAGGAGRDATPEGSIDVHFSVGARSSSITVFKGATPVEVHHVPAGCDDNPDTVVLEVKRRLLALLSGEDALTLGRMTVGGAHAQMDRLLECLASEFDAPVKTERLEDNGAVFDSRSLPDTRDGRQTFAAAHGAALIAAENTEELIVNLRVGPFRRAPRIAGYRPQFLTAAALALLGVAVWGVSYIHEGMALDRQYADIKQAIRSAFTEVMPEVKNIVSETQQLKNAMVKMKEKSRALGVGDSGRDPFLDILLGLTLAAPKDTKLDVEELVYETERIRLKGRTDSFEQVDRLKKNIAALNGMGKVSVERAKATVSGDAVNFKIEVEMR